MRFRLRRSDCSRRPRSCRRPASPIRPAQRRRLRGLSRDLSRRRKLVASLDVRRGLAGLRQRPDPLMQTSPILGDQANAAVRSVVRSDRRSFRRPLRTAPTIRLATRCGSTTVRPARGSRLEVDHPEPNLVDHPRLVAGRQLDRVRTRPRYRATSEADPFQSGIDVIARSNSTWSAPTVLVASVAGKNPVQSQLFTGLVVRDLHRIDLPVRAGRRTTTLAMAMPIPRHARGHCRRPAAHRSSSHKRTRRASRMSVWRRATFPGSGRSSNRRAPGI